MKHHHIVSKKIELQLLNRRGDQLRVVSLGDDADSKNKQRILLVHTGQAVIATLICVDDVVTVDRG